MQAFIQFQQRIKNQSLLFFSPYILSTQEHNEKASPLRFLIIQQAERYYRLQQYYKMMEGMQFPLVSGQLKLQFIQLLIGSSQHFKNDIMLIKVYCMIATSAFLGDQNMLLITMWLKYYLQDIFHNRNYELLQVYFCPTIALAHRRYIIQ